MLNGLCLKIQNKMNSVKNFIVKYFKYMHFVIPLIVFTSCGVMPQLLNEVEHVADDTCINIKISQEALRKDTNIKAVVEVENSKYDIKG